MPTNGDGVFQTDDLNLRVETFNRLRELRGRKSSQRHHLAAILGYRHFNWYRKHFNDQDRQTCRMLLGPHGYTVYKMLLIKRGMKPL